MGVGMVGETYSMSIQVDSLPLFFQVAAQKAVMWKIEFALSCWISCSDRKHAHFRNKVCWRYQLLQQVSSSQVAEVCREIKLHENKARVGTQYPSCWSQGVLYSEVLLYTLLIVHVRSGSKINVYVHLKPHNFGAIEDQMFLLVNSPEKCKLAENLA